METAYFYLVKYCNCLSGKHGEKKKTLRIGATLKPGNRKSETGNRNQKPESGIGTGNQKPEPGIRNPQIKENKFFKFAKII